MKRIVVGLISLVGLLATVWLANWAVQHWGLVPVGFGLSAPAGVYFAGLAWTLRDTLHETLGRFAVAGAILAGAALSYFVSNRLAIASAVAFLVSESADFAVYEPLRRRNWTLAVALSNAVGLVLDSLLFLWIAFGSLAFLKGQIVGKAWMTLAALVLFGVLGRRRLGLGRDQVTAGA